MNTFRSSKAATLREVAKAAGVSLASASYALRGNPTVSKETQRRVADVATRLGYRVNPQLAAFMQARRTGRSMREDATVALVHGGPVPSSKEESYFGLCARGVRALAEERGYAVDAIRWNATRDASARGLTRILDERGIRGVLLVPEDKARRWALPLDWARFVGVALDHSLNESRVHRVTDHHTADMVNALSHVKASGGKRPGLVLDAFNNERTLEMRLGAFLARATHDFPKAPPPLLTDAVGEQRAKEVHAWLSQHQPDVVLSPDRSLGELLPPPIRFVSLANYEHSTAYPGIVIDGESVGRTAAFLLFSLLENPVTAAVLKPQTILIEGSWRDALAAGE